MSALCTPINILYILFYTYTSRHSINRNTLQQVTGCFLPLDYKIIILTRINLRMSHVALPVHVIFCITDRILCYTEAAM